MEQNFQDRLKNFHLPPPDGAWNKIDAVLESQKDKGFANKLIQFEIAPPLQVWQKISFKLGITKPSSVKKPVKRYILYASVAASIILSIVSVNLLTGNNNSGTEQSLIAPPKIGTSSNSQPITKQNRIELIDSSNRLIAAEHAPIRKYELPSHKLTLKNIEEHLMGSVSSLEKFVPEFASRNKEISYEDGLDRYMIYASDDGNAVRLPKKMYDNIACPSNDPYCREKIKLLQQKMAQSSFASGFTGILDVLSNMDDRK